MKKMWVVTSFVAVSFASPAYALQHQITPLPYSDLTCENLKGTWQYVANWEPLFDATKPPDPNTRKRPFLIHPTTGKPLADLPSGTHACAGLGEGLRTVHSPQRRHRQLRRRH